MRLPASRCHSSLTIDKECINENRRSNSAINALGNRIPRARASTNTTNGIFWFLHKLGVVNNTNTNRSGNNRNYLAESTYSLYSRPHSTPGTNRWESAESVLSSTTANSFAFIPCRQLRYSRRDSVDGVQDADDEANARTIHSASYRPRSWATSDERKSNTTRAAVDNVVWSTCDRRDTTASTRLNCNREKTSRCHKPGKRRAPQPPQRAAAGATAASNFRRKKRRAPSPPLTMAQSSRCDNDGVDSAAANVGGGSVVVYNDSLKLEKGVLKANKDTVQIREKTESAEKVGRSCSGVGDVSASVSPKPWYKRSTIRTNASPTIETRSSKAGKREKPDNSCRRYYVDEWMLESVIARHKRAAADRNLTNKRVSQISMLANISELDRQACEIIDRERKRERDFDQSVDAKFYSSQSQSQSQSQSESKQRYLNCSPTVTRKDNVREVTVTKKSRSDLISILSNITNVTKVVAVNSSASFSSSTKIANMETSAVKERRRAANSFFHRVKSFDERDTLQNQGSSTTSKTSKLSAALKQSAQNTTNQNRALSATATNSAAAEQNELKDQSLSSETIFSRPTLCTNNNDTDERQRATRPVKPFSSWICPQCSLENPSWKFICETCNKWRPYSMNRDRVQLVNVEAEPEHRKREKTAAVATTTADSPSSVPSSFLDYSSIDVGSDGGGGGSDGSDSDMAVRKHFQQVANDFVQMSSDKTDSDTENNKNMPKARSECFGKHVENVSLYYSDHDREKLRNILKELNDSLPPRTNNARLFGNHSKIAQIQIPPTATAAAIVNQSHVKRSKHAALQDSAAKHTLEQNNNSIDNIVDDDHHDRRNVAFDSNAIFAPASSNSCEQAGIIVNANENIASSSSTASKDLNINDYTSGENLSKECKKVTALAINRLLKKLQTSIANGQHHEAANIARELARLKVDCHMTSRQAVSNGGQSSSTIENLAPTTFVISLFINEGNDCRGPIPLQIDRTMTLKQLKMKMYEEFKIASNRQRWFFDNAALNDESKSLEVVGIGKTAVPLYLNLIPANNPEKFSDTITENRTEIDQGNEKKAQEKMQNTSVPVILSCSEHESVLAKKNDHSTDEKHNSTDINFQIDNHDGGGTEKKRENKDNAVSTSTNEIDDNRATNDAWKCGLCTLINENETKFCSACGQQRQTINMIECNSPKSLLSENGNQFQDKDNYEMHPIWRRNDDKTLNYQELIDLEKNDLITNVERFECCVCFVEYDEGAGVVLRDCLHTFCKDCLKQTIQFSTEAEVKCPFSDGNYSCDSVIQEREIKALVDADVYEKHLARSMSEAENKMENAFHCKTVNCPGWCIYEDNVNEFHCPVCQKLNCLTCQVIHMGLNCKQYQEMSKVESESSNDANKTKSMLEEMVEKGEAMICPTCQIILMKKWGCDWLRCSMCKTEICWITRGPRWGPAGKGDTTAGCRCGVNGIKCHPRCNYCH